MKTLILAIILLSFALFIYLSTKIADYHYKTYKGDNPLFVYYGFLAMLLWAIFVSAILEYNKIL